MGFGSPYLAVLHVHHSDGDPQRGRLVRVGERDHVRPARARPDDRLALRQRTQPGQGIAQQGGALELLFCCRTSHLLLDRRSDGRDLAAEDVDRPVDILAVPVRVDRPDARGAAHAEMVVQARRFGEANAASESEQVAQQPLHAPRLPDACVRPEQEQTGAATRPADEEDAGKLLVQGDGEVGEAPVVLQKDVVRRLVLLDQARLEEERLALRPCRDELDARAARDDRAVLLDAGP